MNENAQQAMEMIKAVFDEGMAEINGREYEYTSMRHNKRKSVFAFYSSMSEQVQTGNFAFLDYPVFTPIEKIINDSVMFDGSLISKLPDHWDEYPEDYVTFIVTALGVISYPFLRGRSTGSQSQAEEVKSQKSKKPM